MKPLLLIIILLISISTALGQDFLVEKNVKAITLLPPVGESVPSSVRNSSGVAFSESLKKTYPSIVLSEPTVAMERLENANAVADFSKFLNLFVKTGMIDKAALRTIASACNAETFMLIDVQDFEAQNGSWVRGRSVHNSARVQYTLFSKDGIQIWQHLVVYVHTPQWTAKADKHEKVMADVSNRAVSALRRGVQNGDPKKDVGSP